MVYLSADSENTIEVLDKEAIYIIGGIVDHNRYKKLTLEKAEKMGLKHGKLPIKEHIELTTSHVLTVNHIFELMAWQYELEDWKQSLRKIIPERKWNKKDASEKNEEKPTE